MKIEVKELCVVDYIKVEDWEIENGELTSIRTIVYDSPKENLDEAIHDYHNNFNFDNLIHSNDDFDGEYQEFIEYVSVKEWY